MGVIQRTFWVEADPPLQFSTAFLSFLTWMLLGSGPISARKYPVEGPEPTCRTHFLHLHPWPLTAKKGFC